MINADEIREFAAQVRLQPTVVEKDYAIGWFLAGIGHHPEICDTWIFKGGTCLKKCYFETYRFSEDLDFSLAATHADTPLTVDRLNTIFHEVSDWVMDACGLALPRDGISFEEFQNPRGTASFQGKAAYRGPITGTGNIQRIPKIKIDLTLDEPLVLAPARCEVDHPYSDLPTGGIKVQSYCYEEIFAEKTRALAQRLRPRDLYDVIHFYRRLDLNPNQALVLSTLQSKCALRGIPVPTLATIETHDNRAALESEWETQLKHQIPVLPPFGEFLSELPHVLEWIQGTAVEQPAQLVMPSTGETEGTITSEPVRGMVMPGAQASMMGKIRFAAANRLLIKLEYGGEIREIEPYALARSSDGNLLLRAIKARTGESRTYRWDRIQSIEVSETPFRPQYQVEITSAGYLPVHQLTRQASQDRSGYSSGPLYVYRCTRCHKTFKRKTMDYTLKEHKDRNGKTCYGTYGTYVKTKY